MDCTPRATPVARPQAAVRQRCAYDHHCMGRDFVAGELVWVYTPKWKKGLSPKLDWVVLPTAAPLDIGYGPEKPYRDLSAMRIS
ncbi:hypothetical protein AAFF_G00052270 [Aldrovandia affinis]|uniref:Uncharacterized protein n=1 Tax=Aldrovandia affinis TaxID=143900 RepID=A0AAD7WYY4_9TELE|nr:hypothetical protein AAFF_G00052270 [Aldrovandia affinis]